MRLVFAIISFCLAAVFLGAGVAQRTVFLQPGSIDQSFSAQTEAVYTVVTPEVLEQHPGGPTLSASGDAAVAVAFGRLDDMMAWIGNAAYAKVSLANSGEIKVEQIQAGDSKDVLADQAVTGTPYGSDLWLSQGVGERTAQTTANMPDGYAAIVASDGTAAAPEELALSWPVDNATPWVGPFFVLGAMFFAVGAVLVTLHWIENHRPGGPRRKGSAVIKAPKQKAITRAKGPKRRELGPVRRRSRAGFIAIPALLSAFALTGCSPQYWPSGTTLEPAPTETAVVKGADGETLLQPAVTVPQMTRVLGEISTYTATADAAIDTKLLTERFAGPALAARTANYQIRAKKSDYAAMAAIPANPLTITLPQQVEHSWPRLVMTVSQNDADPSLAPVALVMLQNAPRSNYQVFYAITLVPNAQSPKLAPASIGAPRIPADSKLLKVQPNQLAAAYADVLMNDTASQYAPLFQVDGDTLRTQLGKAGQDAIRAQLPANSAIEFSAGAGSGPALTLASNDSGGIVAVQVDQTRKITPTDGGVVGFAEGSASAALSGFTAKSARGVQSTSGLQLLFYVPAVDSTEPIRLLGWTESLIAASEVP